MKWWQKQALKLPVELYVNGKLHCTEREDILKIDFIKSQFESAGYKVELKEANMCVTDSVVDGENDEQ
jgi:hypothetical protein